MGIWRALNLFREGSSELCTGFAFFTGFCLDARIQGDVRQSIAYALLHAEFARADGLTNLIGVAEGVSRFEPEHSASFLCPGQEWLDRWAEAAEDITSATGDAACRDTVCAPSKRVHPARDLITLLYHHCSIGECHVSGHRVGLAQVRRLGPRVHRAPGRHRRQRRRVQPPRHDAQGVAQVREAQLLRGREDAGVEYTGLASMFL